jgi:hypothetical protein
MKSIATRGLDPARTFSANLGDLFGNARRSRFSQSLLQAMISGTLLEISKA